MKVVKGDLLQLASDGHFDVIIHGCNCQKVMGAGIAKQIALRWPRARKADLAFIPTNKGQLGDFSEVGIVNHDKNLGFFIINAYTQWMPGRGQQVSYDAIDSVFSKIVNKFSFPGVRFGIPKIGAGLAGGNWNIISAIINEHMRDKDLTLVEYEPAAPSLNF